jgi:prepilin-type N-terminal cleavage/methylation domain-containing protein
MMRGFTLVELLIAMVVVLLLAGAMAAAASQARAVFERVPAVIDMQQRGNAAIDTLSQALRAAVRVTAEMPEDEGAFSQLSVIRPIDLPGQGVLAIDQASPAGAITLAASPCPNVKDVCGFTSGAVAMIAEGPAFDVFIVGTTVPAQRRLTPKQSLSRAYRAGATVLEVEEQIFGLDQQPDGTYSLTRVTAAGAVQPIVDGIRSLSFGVDGSHVDIRVVVHASTEALQRVIADRPFRTSISVRNKS